MKIILVILLSIIYIYANNIEERIPYKIAKQKAKKTAHMFHELMKQNVKRRLNDEGVLSAAIFCAEDSYNMIKQFNKELGYDIDLKRISFNNRNPKSHPLEDEEKILKAFDLIEKSDAFLPKEIVQYVGDDIYKVYFPATMSSKSCKVCHGLKETIDPKIKKLFRKKYKEEKAYGFKSGQIRGAVVVTVEVH